MPSRMTALVNSDTVQMGILNGAGGIMAAPYDSTAYYDIYTSVLSVFRIRREINGNPEKIANDPLIKSYNAVVYALSAPTLGLTVALTLSGMVAFFMSDYGSLWEVTRGEAWQQIQSLFLGWTFGVVNIISALVTAEIVVRTGASERIQQRLPIFEIRRRFFLSNGTEGYIPTVLGTTVAVFFIWLNINDEIARCLVQIFNYQNLTNFMSEKYLDLSLNGKMEFYLWGALITDGFGGIAQFHNMAINIAEYFDGEQFYSLFVFVSLVLVLFYVYVRPVWSSSRLFARSLRDDREYEIDIADNYLIFARMFFVRFATLAVGSFFFVALSALFFQLYELGLWARQDLGLTIGACQGRSCNIVVARPTDVSPQCPTCVKPPVEAFATKYVIYFGDNTAELLEAAKPELDEVAAQFSRLSKDYDVKLVLTAYLTKREENQLKSDMEAVRMARANAVKEALTTRKDNPVRPEAVEIAKGEEARVHGANDLPFNLMQRVTVQLVLNAKANVPSTPPAADAATAPAPG